MKHKKEPKYFLYSILLIFLLAGLQNITQMLNGIKWAFSVITPFVTGGCIAFIINVPMNGIEGLLFKNTRKKSKWQRVISLFATLFFSFGSLSMVLILVLPELSKTIGLFTENLPLFKEQLQLWYNRLPDSYPGIYEFLTNFQIDWVQVISNGLNFIQTGTGTVVNYLLEMAAGIVSGIVQFFMGLVFAIYILLEKEKLAKQGKQVLYSLLPKRSVNHILGICELAHTIFSKFLSGQCLEALILGSLFFVLMNVFRFQYPLLISLLIGVLSLIPLVGSFIGCLIGVVLIGVTDLSSAAWFFILFIGVQQLEGNFIYPRVVGNSVGLPSMWVMAAVTLGGRMFGIVGILLNIPLCALLYILFREFVKKRIANKKINI